MLEVSGNGFKVIADWRKLFDDGEAAVSLASRAMAEEMLDMTRERFRVETDPYGRRWKRKKRPDGRKVLSGKTSRLKGGWHIVRCDNGGWMIAPSVEYAAYHQKPGSRTMKVSMTRRVQGRSINEIARTLGINLTEEVLARPRRMMVPDNERGLPLPYQRALTEATQDALTVHFAGGGRSVPHSINVPFSIRAIARRMVRAAVAGSDG